MADKIKRLDGSQPGNLARKLEVFLKERIKGQDRAIKGMVIALDRWESGFRDKNRPIYSVLSMGPSGVGKTYMAECLAEFFFGDRNALTPIACSEYQERHRLSQLMGAPPGYVGFYNPDDQQYRGVEPILSQFQIDKHDFLYQQQNDKKVQEALKRMDALKKKKESLMSMYERHRIKKFQQLSDFQKKQAKELEEIEKQLGEVEEELKQLKKKNPQDPRIRDLSRKKGELSAELNDKAYQQDDEARREQMRLGGEVKRLWSSVSTALTKIEAEIDQLSRQNQEKFAYSPDKPYESVILFDEIEKAHPALHQFLLEVMDKGRATLANGNVTKFANSFIILTSNIGSAKIARLLNRGGLGFKTTSQKDESQVTDQEIYKEVMREASKYFPSEFRGRLNNTIVFRPLSREILREIFDTQINREVYGLFAQNDFPIVLKISTRVKDFIINEATDKMEYGARLLKDKIGKYIIDPLGRLKNNQEITKGDIVQVLLLKTKEGKKKIIFRPLPRPEQLKSGSESKAES